MNGVGKYVGVVCNVDPYGCRVVFCGHGLDFNCDAIVVLWYVVSSSESVSDSKFDWSDSKYWSNDL